MVVCVCVCCVCVCDSGNRKQEEAVNDDTGFEPGSLNVTFNRKKEVKREAGLGSRMMDLSVYLLSWR